MKHAIPLVFILAVLCGCATKPAVITPNYDALILEDIVQVISWLDDTQYFSSTVNRAQTLASVFLETYPDEMEVVLAFLEVSLDMAQDIKNSYLAIKSYTQMHYAYINDKTAKQGEILYQQLNSIITDIQHWYVKYPVWSAALNILKNAMNRRGFDYSAVP